MLLLKYLKSIIIHRGYVAAYVSYACNVSRYCGAHAQRLFYQYILCSKFSKRNKFLLKLQGP